KLDADDPALRGIVEEVKKMEHMGYAYEAADASLELLIQKMRGKMKDYFKLHGYRVVDERRDEKSKPVSEAAVHLEAPTGEMLHTAGLGEGPVDALNNALMKALAGFYPVLAEVHLIDFKVRILNARNGTKATTRVLIESSDGKMHWTTVGVDSDILGASYTALVDSVRYKLYKENI
ncbi:MAG TPA: alpha-isopropylmalate synthase regulatory domain-containing protein, partial [Gammaproteobacteria bacterium]